MHIAQTQIELESLTIAELRHRYAEVFGETTNSRHRSHLVRRILWGMQASTSGGLREAFMERARELAAHTQMRLTPPPGATAATTSGSLSTTPNRDGLRAGTLLTREYKGRVIRVAVVDGGFEFEGVRYRSLSGVAKVVTGSHWNGRNFFGLCGRKE